MQSTIDEKDKEIIYHKNNKEIEQSHRQAIEEQLEGYEELLDKILNFSKIKDDEIGKLKQKLEIANNRIKYEFKGE